MGMELELMSFSTLIFGILLAICFKPLQGSYVAKEMVQNKKTEQERHQKQQAFSKELEEIKSDFELKFAEALRGELNK